MKMIKTNVLKCVLRVTVLASLEWMFASTLVFAQSIGDHRSYQSGDWSDPGTWELWDGANWIQEYNVLYPGSVTLPGDGFPVIGSTATSAKTNTNNAAHVITLPTGIVAGDLILVFWTDADNSGTNPTLAGYTQLASSNNSDEDVYRKVWYRIADGTEGATVSTNAFGDRSAHVAYRIEAGTYQGVPFISTNANGTNSAPNPANLDPGLGSQRYLWIASAHAAESQTFVIPADLTDALDASSTASSTSSSHCQVITARRFLEGNALDPGAFSLGGNATHTAWTVAIQGFGGTYPHPVIVNSATGVQSGANATSHAISIPEGLAGDMLVTVFSVDGNPTVTTTSTGWNKLGQGNEGSVVGAVFWKMASGPASGDDALSLTTSASERSSHVTYRIRGASGISGSSATNDNANSNPPSHSPAEASYLWIATRSGDAQVVATAAPANYFNMLTVPGGHTDGASTNTAFRIINPAAASEDPGVFTSGTEDWVSWTLAILGPAPVPGTEPIDIPRMASGDGFPVVGATASSAKTTTGSAPHVVDLPVGIQEGDMILVFWTDASNSGTDPVLPGYTQLATSNAGTSNVYRKVWYRIADGTEGATVSTSNSFGDRSAHVTYRIAAGTYTGLPYISTNANNTNNAPDPNNLNPGLGVRKFLWLASAHAAESQSFSIPATFSDAVDARTTASSTDNAHAQVVTARRALEAEQLNVGPFGLGGNATHTAWTVAIQGADGSHATVRNGHVVTVTEDGSVDDLVVESAGLLDISTGTLVINGTSVVVHGSITGASGHLILGDINEAAILVQGSGSMDLFDLTARTPADVTLEVDLDIRGTLAVRAGDFDATSATVRLISNVDGTGRLDSLVAGTSYTGILTMQRYIPAGATNWRLLGSAVDGQTLQHWKDDFLTAGFPGSHYPNFDMPVGSGILWPSIRYYNEADLGPNPLDGLTGAESITEPLSAGKGWAVWCGDTLGTTAAFTIDVKGPPRIAQTPIALPVSWSNGGTPLVDGYNLVSNPLPSPISFAAIQRGADVENYYWVFNPVDGNNATWNGTVGANGANGIIQSSQGFWLKANGPSVATTVHESAKVSGNTGGIFGGLTTIPPMVRLTLQGNNSFKDEAVVVFQDGTPQLNSGDVPKLSWSSAGAPRIALRSAEGVNLTIDMYGEYTTDISIPVLVQAPSAGTYKVRATDMAGINSLTCLTLVDLVTGTITPLTEGMEYNFSMPASPNTNTPRLLLRASAPLPQYATDATCSDAANGSATVVNISENAIEVTWSDLLNNVLHVQSDVMDMATFTGLQAGEYNVTVSSAAGCGPLSSTITIHAPDALVADVETTEASCPDAEDGMLSVEVVGGTAPYSYLWDNGGEEAHITGATGDHAVTITDANGCVLQVTGLAIGAGQGPVAAFSHGPGPVVVGTPIEFTNNSIGMQSSTWDFGDGNGSTEPDPTHTYTMAGMYTVTLTVNNGDCTDSWSTEVVVELSTGLEDIGPAVITSWAVDDQLFLDHDLEGGMMLVELVDVAGKLHHQWSVGALPGRVSFPIAGLSAGVWVVRVIHDGAQHTFRVPLVR